MKTVAVAKLSKDSLGHHRPHFTLRMCLGKTNKLFFLFTKHSPLPPDELAAIIYESCGEDHSTASLTQVSSSSCY